MLRYIYGKGYFFPSNICGIQLMLSSLKAYCTRNCGVLFLVLWSPYPCLHFVSRSNDVISFQTYNIFHLTNGSVNSLKTDGPKMCLLKTPLSVTQKTRIKMLILLWI